LDRSSLEFAEIASAARWRMSGATAALSFYLASDPNIERAWHRYLARNAIACAKRDLRLRLTANMPALCRFAIIRRAIQ
jgi:hypothetical protein